MRKGKQYPASVSEAKKRIRSALQTIRGLLVPSTGEFFDEHVAYRVCPGPSFIEPELVKALNQELDRQRGKLSSRVARFYRRSGRQSLVRQLLRRSPVFLRDRWVVDLILERRRAATTNPDSSVRREARRDLKQLLEAATFVPPDARGRTRVRRWKRIDALELWASIRAREAIQDRYEAYLEIGTCVKQLRHLTMEERRRASTSKAPEEILKRYATILQIPMEWIRDCWKGATKPHAWALRRSAADSGTTPDGVRRQLASSKKYAKSGRATFQLTLAASERLAPDRRAKANERVARGGFGYLRRY